MKHLLVIAGPTASGKSAAGLEIAQYFSTPIISADSRQIYKELSAGTAVPTISDRNKVQHYLVQHRSIHDYYNVSMYEMEVMDLLPGLFLKHDVVLLVGGSGLYIDAVCNGIDDLPVYDPDLRKELTRQLETEGVESLRHQLKKLDPEYYALTDLKNGKRILRALEVCLQTGKTYTSLRIGKQKSRNFNIIRVLLQLERNILYEKINSRVEDMIRSGLENEARSLLPYRHLNALNTVGYKELFDHFDGKCSLAEAIEKIKQNTRNYARRQISWFGRNGDYREFAPANPDPVIQYVQEVMKGVSYE
jgi:tRNA dimethylallyltransferase